MEYIILSTFLVVTILIFNHLTTVYKEHGCVPIKLKKVVVMVLLALLGASIFFNLYTVKGNKAKLNAFDNSHEYFVEMLKGTFYEFVNITEDLLVLWDDIDTQEKLTYIEKLLNLGDDKATLRPSFPNLNQIVSSTIDYSTDIKHITVGDYRMLSISYYDFMTETYWALQSEDVSEYDVKTNLEYFVYDCQLIIDKITVIQEDIKSQKLTGRRRIDQWVISLYEAIIPIKENGKSPFLLNWEVSPYHN